MQVGSSAESGQQVAIWKSPHRDSGRGLSLEERIRNRTSERGPLSPSNQAQQWTRDASWLQPVQLARSEKPLPGGISLQVKAGGRLHRYPCGLKRGPG
ncbi:hypothetical protein J1605_005093 [Eschrichtius robustus]|uniref:Uncharacterized protein n=1 Tax=Eschrichtius robustus TaxID=9764 RepID=A0AB34HC98_ESCRO|nr:hypothetical protein J1605_005093 [Eschrichtius robustus]